MSNICFLMSAAVCRRRPPRFPKGGQADGGGHAPFGARSLTTVTPRTLREALPSVGRGGEEGGGEQRCYMLGPRKRGGKSLLRQKEV